MASSEPWSQAMLGDLRVARLRGHARPVPGGLCPRGRGACPSPRSLPPSPAVYIVLGRVFLLCAVLFSFLTVFAMVSFASDLFPGTWKHNLVSAFISFLTGVDRQVGVQPWGGGRGRGVVSEVRGHF